MIFYTADPHFGYDAIRKTAARPFPSTDEMDEALISRWNRVVTDDDTVYLVGDIGSYRTPVPTQQLSRLRGHKHLIRGNHDTCIPNQQQLLDYFETVTDFLELDDGDFHITLCHYPLVYMQHGYMIHGHLHNAQRESYRILQGLPHVLNAGVDINDFCPVTLPQLIENNRRHYGRPDTPEETRPMGRPRWDAVFHPLPQREERK